MRLKTVVTCGTRAGVRFAQLALAATLVVPGPARAADAACGPEQAKKLFNEGLTHLEADKWAQGCAAFSASLTCRPRASTQVRVAACLERENKLTDALVAYRKALNLEKNPQTAAQLDAEIQSNVEALDQRIPRLTFVIDMPVEALRVRLDDRDLSPEELEAPLLVDPGTHRLVVNSVGYEEKHLEVTVVERGSSAVDLRLASARRQPAAAVPEHGNSAAPETANASPASVPPTDAASRERQPAAVRSGSAERTAGLVIGGAGVVSLAVASAFAARTVSLVGDAKKYCYGDDTCDQPGLDMLGEARRAQTVGLVMGGFGLLALGGGIVLVATHPSAPQGHTGSSQSRGGVVSRLAVIPMPAGIMARGAF